MKIRSAMTRSAGALALFASGFAPATAATEKVLYSFPAYAGVYGQPVQGGKGTLYGTAAGLDGNGAISPEGKERCLEVQNAVRSRRQ